MDPYIIIGHGEEEQLPFDSRKRIPEGYALVTLAECGTVTQNEEVSKIVEAFGHPENAPTLQNPIANKDTIQSIMNGHQIHCYTEGMYYPNMFVHLLADWESVNDVPKDSKKIVAVKSGVYKFPLTLDKWRLRDEETFEKSMYGTFGVTGGFNPYLTNPEDVATRIYSDSVLPTSEEVLGILQSDAVKGSLGRFKKHIVFSLDQVFEKCGPGVYYYVICRSPKNNTFASYINTSIGKNLPKHIDEARNKIQYIPELMPKMEELAIQRHAHAQQKFATFAEKKGVPVNTYQPTSSESYSAKGWNYNEITEAPAKYQQLYNNTMRIRRASMNQQALHNTKNKRRRTRKQSRQRKQRKTR